MGEHRVGAILTDAELAAIEHRVGNLPDEQLRDEVLRLIAEVREARAARGSVARRRVASSGVRSDETTGTPADADYVPSGGRVSIAEWQAIATRLRAQRSLSPPVHPTSPQEEEERGRRWEAVRARLGWDAQAPLTPEQEAEVEALVREEIAAHRRESQQEPEHDAYGR
jgi:hypothetical protein